MSETSGHSDADFMRMAVKISGKGKGRIAGIRPSVGCVIVNPVTLKIISIGKTSESGNPHAETDAIQNAIASGRRDHLKGATAYVTLEPCSHTSSHKPVSCAQNLINHGIERVVVACDDPDPKVNGNGYKKMEDAGIAITKGVLKQEAETVLKEFFTAVRNKRPFVTLKMAVSADGKVGIKDMPKTLITGPQAQAHAHSRLRYHHKAIMAGIGTVLDDNPALTTRVHKDIYPSTRIILDSQLRLPKGSKILQTASDGNPLLLIFNENAETPDFLKQAANVNLIRVQDTRNLSAVLKLLATDDYGITSLLVEGGPTLIQSFLSSGLWDEAYVYRSPLKIGEAGINGPQFSGYPIEEAENIGNDKLEIYRNS